MLSPELEALRVPADSVRPHPDNPNNGDVDAIVESIVLDGVYRPIYASRATGHIVAGHHVYAAMLSEGMQTVPVIFLDVTPEEELRILAKDNQLARMAWMDPALETELVKRIAQTDQGLAGTGYDDAWLIKAITSQDSPYTPGAVPTNEVQCPNCGHAFPVESDSGF